MTTAAASEPATSLLARLRRLGSTPASGFEGVAGPIETGWLEAGAPLAEAEAEIVEGDAERLRARAVGAPGAGALACFLDGIQRAGVALFREAVPVVYAYGAAVIRVRRDGRMATLTDAAERPYLEEREAAFFPFSLLAPEAVEAHGIPRARLVDTSEGVSPPPPLFPPALYARAAERINHWREEIERRLAERWCESGASGWLLVDGSLTVSPELAQCPRALGVIKSHRTRFFDTEDARVVLGLRAGERTSVFRPTTRQFTPVYSWYLRLRSPAGHDALWGLVRVEAAAHSESIERADEISRWLLAETAPLALPDARWDRLLYAIRDCEEYLRARAPRL